MAECDETKEIVGFLMWHYTYSSWHAQCIYLENIYVRAEHRRKKIGHRLLQELCTVIKKSQLPYENLMKDIINFFGFRSPRKRGLKKLIGML